MPAIPFERLQKTVRNHLDGTFSVIVELPKNPNQLIALGNGQVITSETLKRSFKSFLETPPIRMVDGKFEIAK